MSPGKVYVRFLVWRMKHISDKNFVLLLSGVVGAISGVAAVILKQSVHLIEHFLTTSDLFSRYNSLFILYPLIGILLTTLVARYILKESLGHGITNILYSISKNSSVLRKGWTYSRMITSALTVGFGGSVGLEAPIVVTGSAIGSNIAKNAHLSYKRRTLLIGCGSAGAIAAIFNSPIAGVIFSIEVIMAEVTIAAFTPLLIASVCGSLISLILSGEHILFSFQLTDPFTAGDTPYFLLLGAICGLVSLYFVRVVFYVENLIQSVKSYLPRALFGGIILGLIIFIFPPIYGEGYTTIKALLSGKEIQLFDNSLLLPSYQTLPSLILFTLGLILIKPIATALTIGSGGSGGIFAPSLFLGGITGFLSAILINTITFSQTVSPSNFTLVGMCGVMSGVLHAPLTAIFLIAEITSGYTLFVPLMLVSAISYSTISYFEKYSFYTKHLVEKGDLIPNDKDRELLSLIDLHKIIETDLLQISPNAYLKDLVDLVKRSKRNIFPVVNSNGGLSGVVTLDDIRDIMFETDYQNSVRIRELMQDPPAFVSSREKMQSVMNKFEKTEAWNLPVIDEGIYIGFVSKSRIFNAYRRKLRRQVLD
ncbi:MAG: chloride channel protein [Bacteroidota bacterium]